MRQEKGKSDTHTHTHIDRKTYLFNHMAKVIGTKVMDLMKNSP